MLQVHTIPVPLPWFLLATFRAAYLCNGLTSFLESSFTWSKFHHLEDGGSRFSQTWVLTHNHIQCQTSVEIPTRCSFVIEFIISKFFKGSTCFKRHTAHHQELQTVFAASGLYTHVVTGRCPVPTQTGQRPVTIRVYKPEAANTVWSS